MMIEERIEKLRKLLKERNIDAFYITGSDAHQSEYVAPRWRGREYLTGFTGSSGSVVITQKSAALFTDSRYFIQAAREIEKHGVILMKSGTSDPDPVEYIKREEGEKATVAVDSSEISISEYREMKKALSPLSLIAAEDILSLVWTDRSPVPFSPVVMLSDDITGETCGDKIERVRAEIKKKGAHWTFISSLDDIAWLTNLRASDIPHNPVFYAYMLITEKEAVLYTEKNRFESLYDLPFSVRAYEEAVSDIENHIDGTGYINDKRVSMSFSFLEKYSLITGRDVTTDMKAQKNEIEMEGMRKAHLDDAVSYVNFLSRLEREGAEDEIAVSDMLEREREKREDYLESSFSPISAFASNGAMCHYSASEESNRKITRGLLVLDTGGQYKGGTTDITRTLLFGEATEEEKRDYTLVLKGHLALSRQKFIKGTAGCQLDVLAHQFLWNEGMSYFHGTGHGVGCRLNVHEGPMNISTRLVDVPLLPGMVISDEPGLYKENRHGIRIENLIAVKEDMDTEFGTFYSFEVLTLVPYEKRLIDMSLLTEVEKAQIDMYHERVRKALIPYVEKDAVKYLEKATSPLKEK